MCRLLKTVLRETPPAASSCVPSAAFTRLRVIGISLRTGGKIPYGWDVSYIDVRLSWLVTNTHDTSKWINKNTK